MDFMTRLSVSSDWKCESYDLIFIIINQLTKMIYYKQVKIMINIPDLAKIIINIMVKHYSLFNFIITD